jgi:hypothetical protein
MSAMKIAASINRRAFVPASAGAPLPGAESAGLRE